MPHIRMTYSHYRIHAIITASMPSLPYPCSHCRIHAVIKTPSTVHVHSMRVPYTSLTHVVVHSLFDH